MKHKNYALMIRKIEARLTNWLFPSYSTCGRCDRNWKICEGHTTYYERRRGVVTQGCFPLCEACWGELSPKERLPYYRNLWQRWVRDTRYGDQQGLMDLVAKKKAIEKAVLQGL